MYLFERLKQLRYKVSKQQLMFSAIYAIFWAAYASFPFEYVFYSQSAGFSSTEIGLIYSGVSLVSILVQPIFGMIADTIHSTRKVLLVALLFGILGSVCFSLAPTKGTVLLSLGAYTFFMAASMPLFDNWVMRESLHSQSTFHYGQARVWGCVGYAIVAFAYGRITEWAPVSFVFFGRGMFLLATLVLIFLCKKETPREAPVVNPQGTEKPDVKGLLRTKPYVLFFVFTFIFYLPLNAASTFFPNLLLSVGGTNQTLGLFACINAIVEIPFFAYGHRITKRFGSMGLMFIGCLFIIFRMLGFGLFSSIPALLVFYFFMAPYTGFFNPGMIEYIYSLAPRNTEAVAQTTIQAYSIALAGMIGNSLAGILIERQGIRSLYLVGAVINGIALLYFILVIMRGNLKKDKDKAANPAFPGQS